MFELETKARQLRGIEALPSGALSTLDHVLKIILLDLDIF